LDISAIINQERAAEALQALEDLKKSITEGRLAGNVNTIFDSLPKVECVNVYVLHTPRGKKSYFRERPPGIGYCEKTFVDKQSLAEILKTHTMDLYYPDNDD